MRTSATEAPDARYCYCYDLVSRRCPPTGHPLPPCQCDDPQLPVKTHLELYVYRRVVRASTPLHRAIQLPPVLSAGRLFFQRCTELRVDCPIVSTQFHSILDSTYTKYNRVQACTAGTHTRQNTRHRSIYKSSLILSFDTHLQSFVNLCFNPANNRENDDPNDTLQMKFVTLCLPC